MSLRTISITDPPEYKFETNSSYKKAWAFIPDPDAANVIAQQLTYLNFHAWLFSKLRHTSVVNPSQPSPLVLDVADGFPRTDILLYGAICETALYVILEASYKKAKAARKPLVEELLKCFEKEDLKFTPLNGQTFVPSGGSDPVKIGHAAKSIRLLGVSEIKFVNLIKASSKMGICDQPLVDSLEQLREERNTIHLGVHSKLRAKKKRGFLSEDVERAKDTTEKLRVALEAFLS